MGGLTSVSRRVHLQVGLSGPSGRRRVPPPCLLLGRLLHLLVVVVPAGEPSGSQRRPRRARPGPAAVARGGGGTGRAGSVGCGARSRGSCPVALQACSRVPDPGLGAAFHLNPVRGPPPSLPKGPQRPPSPPSSSTAPRSTFGLYPDVGKREGGAELLCAQSSRRRQGGAEGRDGAGQGGQKYYKLNFLFWPGFFLL